MFGTIYSTQFECIKNYVTYICSTVLEWPIMKTKQMVCRNTNYMILYVHHKHCILILSEIKRSHTVTDFAVRCGEESLGQRVNVSE
jgi:hypothetical protein